MGKAGRRPGRNDTREQVLTAAREVFGDRGYDRATVRAIAAEAGVSPAMVHHYFGSKQQVFVATVQLPFDPSRVKRSLLEGPREQAGERVVRTFLAIFADPEVRAPFVAALRSITGDEETTALLREFMDSSMFGVVAEALGVPAARLNAAAGQMIGLVMTRYVLQLPPIATATDDEVVAMIAPVIQYYLDGTALPRGAPPSPGA
ncbi:TetR/AcrR family transcriptional regulator [Salinifilum ghardaiensis]